MTYAVRVEEDYVGLMGRYVAEGQSIVPGARLLDIMTPEGVVETIVSEGWGIVAHVEGARIFSKSDSNDNNAVDEEEEGDDGDDGESGQARGSSGGMGAVFSKGDVVCHIVARSDRAQAGKGLKPCPSESLRLRRTGAMAPRNS